MSDETTQTSGSNQGELVRSVFIQAKRETVYRYFSDAEKFAQWFGEGSKIAAEAGADVFVQFPNGATAQGEVLEANPPENITFTWGYKDEEKNLPVGSTKVEVNLFQKDSGTLVILRHYGFDSDALRNAHDGGWRFLLSHLAFAAAFDQFAEGIEETANKWFASWGEEDLEKCIEMLAEITDEQVLYLDQHATVIGHADLAGHMAAARQHMPDVKVQLGGDIQLSHGTALVPWECPDAEGNIVATGKVVFDLNQEGQVKRAVAFWNA